MLSWYLIKLLVSFFVLSCLDVCFSVMRLVKLLVRKDWPMQMEKKSKKIIREFSFILLYLNIQIKKRIPSIKYGFFHPRSAGQVLNTYTTI